MNENRILALGPAGTNGHEAALIAGSDIYRNGKPVIVDFCDRNADVLIRAEKESCPGVVPIENTSRGLVSDVVEGYWLKQTEPPEICVIGQIELPIRHHLMTKSGFILSEIHKVLSHQQALDQCKGTLAKLGITRTSSEVSTAYAAEQVAKHPGKAGYHTAAIASELAAKTYGLRIVKKDIQDSPNNSTRFHVIGKHRPRPTRCDRTALLFKVQNKARALMNALWSFGVEDINMTSIHSISLGSKHEYAFYCEVDCHVLTPKGQDAFARFKTVVDWHLILGSFPISMGEGD